MSTRCRTQWNSTEVHRLLFPFGEGFKDARQEPVLRLPESESFRAPKWAQAPERYTCALDVIKDGAVVGTVDLSRHRCFLVGRQRESCNIPLQHSSISRQHAVLVHSKLGVTYVLDLGSAHGTFIGRVRVTPWALYELRSGAILRFGASSKTYIFRAFLSNEHMAARHFASGEPPDAGPLAAGEDEVPESNTPSAVANPLKAPSDIQFCGVRLWNGELLRATCRNVRVVPASGDHGGEPPPRKRPRTSASEKGGGGNDENDDDGGKSSGRVVSFDTSPPVIVQGEWSGDGDEGKGRFESLVTTVAISSAPTVSHEAGTAPGTRGAAKISDAERRRRQQLLMNRARLPGIAEPTAPNPLAQMYSPSAAGETPQGLPGTTGSAAVASGSSNQRLPGQGLQGSVGAGSGRRGHQEEGAEDAGDGDGPMYLRKG
uniref:FHA domain-containing protein n=1 Tax=Rhizochromulina marina TaxID=1034831 RepID=A0A7S2SR88_9STRA